MELYNLWWPLTLKIAFDPCPRSKVTVFVVTWSKSRAPIPKKATEYVRRRSWGLVYITFPWTQVSPGQTGAEDWRDSFEPAL